MVQLSVRKLVLFAIGLLIGYYLTEQFRPVVLPAVVPYMMCFDGTNWKRCELMPDVLQQQVATPPEGK